MISEGEQRTDCFTRWCGTEAVAMETARAMGSRVKLVSISGMCSRVKNKGLKLDETLLDPSLLSVIVMEGRVPNPSYFI